MTWKRAANRKPGKPYIPDREDLDERNRPLREASEARKAPKGAKKT